MFITGSTVTFNWVLEKTATVYTETSFDLRIQDPDGIATYTEGPGWATSFLAPNETTDGLITEDILLSKPGLYNIVLATGGSANFTVLASQLVMVVDQDTDSTKTVVLA